MGPTLKAHAALLMVNIIYGANYIIAKGVMPDYVGPSGFIVMRVVGAVLLFWLVKSFIKERVAKKDMLMLAICGLFGVCLNQILFFEGLNLTSPLNSAIIMTFNPILVLILASIIIKERVTKTKLAGIAIGSIGAISLIILSNKNPDAISSLQGDLFILANACSYGIYLVLVKPLMAKYKPITVISWVFLFGTGFVLLTPFALPEFFAVKWDSLPTSMIFSILYVVVGTTFLAYLLNIYALKTVNPSVSSSYIYLQPVMVSLFALLYSAMSAEATNYAQDITWTKGGCTLLIFLGVFLISRPAKKVIK